MSWTTRATKLYAAMGAATATVSGYTGAHETYNDLRRRRNAPTDLDEFNLRMTSCTFGMLVGGFYGLVWPVTLTMAASTAISRRSGEEAGRASSS